MKLLKRLTLSIAALSLGAVLATTTSVAAEMKMPKIVDGGIPVALTAVAGNPDEGKKTVANRKLGNCLACHAITSLANQPFHGEVGPSLDDVSKRYSTAQLRLIIVDAKKVFDGTIMPAFHRADGYTRVAKKFEGKTILTGQQVEDILAFLVTQ